jgi:uncharacterized protein YndB with AHSA1/START domain
MTMDVPTTPETLTHAKRISDRETEITRRFAAPRSALYRAWSEADLFRQWWVPQSFGMTLLSCEMDVRTGGSYRLVFANPSGGEPMAFFGTYKDVVPNERIVWTNEESDQGAVTTVTFEERGGGTLLTVRDLFPSKEALDAEGGASEGMTETLDQLDAFVRTLAE